MSLEVTEARVLVGLQATDGSRDERLQQLIDAAYEQAAYFVGPLTATTVTETARNRRGQLLLRRRPVLDVSTVDGVLDVSTLDVSTRTGLIEGLPSDLADGDLTVTYTYGFATVPASVEEGVRSWVKHRAQQESFGSDTYGDDPVTDFDDLPNAVKNAWRPYLISRGLGFA